MKYIRVHHEWICGDLMRAAEDAQRGVWLSLLGYCINAENNGRIAACASWNDRQWMVLCSTSRAGVDAAVGAEIVAWDGADLIVRGFDEQAQAIYLFHRKKGSVAGKKSGIKRNQLDQPSGSPTGPTKRPNQSVLVSVSLDGPGGGPSRERHPKKSEFPLVGESDSGKKKTEAEYIPFDFASIANSKAVSVEVIE